MVAVAEAGVVEEYRVLWWNKNCELWSSISTKVGTFPVVLFAVV